MSDTEEKRYSSKQITYNLSNASIAWRLVEGPEHEEAIDEFCTLFLIGFLGEETYRQVMAELTEEEVRKDDNPATAILAALMVGAGRDNDVAGDV